MIAHWRSKWKKYLLISVLSVIFSVFMDIRWGITFADALFIGAMAFFFVGLMQIANNLGSFTSLSFGFKVLFRIMRNKRKTSKNTKEEYAEHVYTRNKFTDSSALMLTGLMLFLLSVLLSYIM